MLSRWLADGDLFLAALATKEECLQSAAMRASNTNSYNPDQRNLFFISLMGGIFLFVRGVDDIRQAWPEVTRGVKR